MNTFLAIVYLLLSLLGLEAGSRSFVDRNARDGATILESRAEARPGLARFECVRSASGRCHYTVLPARCVRGWGPPWPVGRCPVQPLESFSLAAGEVRHVAGLARFELCVDGDASACAATPATGPGG
jgi:hypothetical protein